MRLYLYGISKKEVAYTPDWIRFSKKDGSHEYTFDLMGDIDYSDKHLDCRVKTTPCLWLIDDKSVHNNLDETEKLSRKKILDIVSHLEDYDITIGLFPASIDEDISEVEAIETAKDDEISNCEGRIDVWIPGALNDSIIKDFSFNYEMNF